MWEHMQKEMMQAWEDSELEGTWYLIPSPVNIGYYSNFLKNVSAAYAWNSGSVGIFEIH